MVYENLNFKKFTLNGSSGPDYLRPTETQQTVNGLGGKDILDVSKEAIYDGGLESDIYIIGNKPDLYAWIEVKQKDKDKIDLSSFSGLDFKTVLAHARTIEARDDEEANWTEHVELKLPNGIKIHIGGRLVEELEESEFVFAKAAQGVAPPAAPSINSGAASRPGWADDASLIGQAPAPEASPADQF